MDWRTAALAAHITAGSAALTAGAVASLAIKGAPLHRRSGRSYVVAMAALLTTGAALAVARDDPFVAVNAVFALYLIATSWWTLNRAPIVAAWLPLAALVCATIDIALGLQALGQPRARLAGYPAAGYFGFAAFAVAAAIGDLAARRRRYRRPAMLARHAWRMSVPLTMAAGSLFLGQQQVLPRVFRGLPAMLLAVAPLVPLLWWLIRLRSAARLARFSMET